MGTKPIKRHEAIRPYSREHHHGLLLCWKIREGLKQNVAVDRIKKYADFLWETQIEPHFKAEEKYMFPILGDAHKMIQKAKKEHIRLAELFNDNTNVLESLKAIQTELDEHIRFEERILFNKIQKVATEKELEIIDQHHEILNSENWDDTFWEDFKKKR